MDTTTAYRQTRLRMTDLFRSAVDRQGATVPACPEWTVTDLAAHVTGVAADVMGGRLDGVGTDPWTAAQVESRRGQSLEEILDEWAEVGPTLEEAFAGGSAPEQLVFDTVTHEHDLRGAIRAPGARDDEAISVGLAFVEQFWPLAARAIDAPALAIETGARRLETGDGAEVTLHLSSFDALRALTGRRSVDQIRAFDWGTDPDPWLGLFSWGPFIPAATDLDSSA